MKDKYSWEGIRLGGSATSDFQQNATESILETWEWLQDYIQGCPHHRIENWLVLQYFYNGLTLMSRGHIDAVTRGAFLSLTID
jgi:hypothetical protein